MKKRNGRILDRKTMEVIRCNAAEPVRTGENFSTVMVWALILERWGITGSVEAVEKLLREWETTPRRPLARAWRQDPEAVAHWRNHRFPALRREAQGVSVELPFLDRTGFRADARMGRTGGAKGKTLVIQRDGRSAPPQGAAGSGRRLRFECRLTYASRAQFSQAGLAPGRA